VLDARWIQRRELTSEDELDQFATFASLLVAKGRNRGEAGVLAYARAHGAIAIIDDGAGRNAAARYSVRYKGTLALLCDSVRTGFLTVSMVSAVADHLLEGEYRLPFAPGGFQRWASESGLTADEALRLGDQVARGRS
jgi:predicted nucleic acid-binding protein